MAFTIQTPTSEAESLILEETGGNTLELNERFLPYRPITLGGKQRAEFTWYPGSPEATVQMLGPEEDTIQLRGFWKDRFFNMPLTPGTGSVAIHPTLPSSASLFTPPIRNVADLVQVVDDMRRMGRQITLKWSGLTRVGHIVGFRHTWHNIHDCEWELDFAVMSQGEQTVPSVGAVQITVPDLYETALLAALEIQAAIFEKTGLNATIAVTNKINAALSATQIATTVLANAMAGVVTGYAGGVLSTAQNVRRTVSTLSGGISNIGAAILTTTQQASSEFYSWAAYGSQDNAPFGLQLSLESSKRNIERSFKRAQYSYTVSRNQAAQQAAALEAQVVTYVAPNNLDLRDVSTRFYKTPNYWRNLMQYNGLNSSRLGTGQRISVPPVSTFSSATGNL